MDNINDLVLGASTQYGVDPALLKGLLDQESSFNPEAIGPEIPGRADRAIGIAQFMPATAKEIGIDPTDPVQSVFGAAYYLRQQIDRFGDVSKGLAAYNHGQGNVRKLLDTHGDTWADHLPDETRDYITKIAGHAQRYLPEFAPAEPKRVYGQDNLRAIENGAPPPAPDVAPGSFDAEMGILRDDAAAAAQPKAAMPRGMMASEDLPINPLLAAEAGKQFNGPSRAGPTIQRALEQASTPDQVADFTGRAKQIDALPTSDQLDAGVGERASRRIIDTLMIDVPKGVVGLGEAAVGLASLGDMSRFIDPDKTGLFIRGMNAIGYDADRTRKIFEQSYSDERKLSEKEYNDAKGVADSVEALLSNPPLVVGKLAESAPMLLGVMGAAGRAYTTAKAAGLSDVAALARAGTIASAGEGALAAGSIAENIRRENPSEVLKIYYAIPAGVATALISKIVGKLPGGSLETMLVPKGQAVAGGALVRGGKGVITEGVSEEGNQSAVEQAATNLGTNKPIGEGMGKAVATGVVIGGIQGGAAAMLHGQRVDPAEALAERARTDALAKWENEGFSQRGRPTPAIDANPLPIGMAAQLASVEARFPDTVLDAQLESLRNPAKVTDIADRIMAAPTAEDAAKLTQTSIDEAPLTADSSTYHPGADTTVPERTIDEHQQAINDAFPISSRETGIGSYNGIPIEAVRESSMPLSGSLEAAGRVTREGAQALRGLYAAAGLDVVFFKDHPDLSDGFVNPNNPSHMFVSDKPQKAVKFITLHEFGHTLERAVTRDGVKLQTVLMEAMHRGMTPEGHAYAKERFGSTVPENSTPAQEADHYANELSKDILGWAGQEKSFWKTTFDHIQTKYGNEVTQRVLTSMIDGVTAALDKVNALFGNKPHDSKDSTLGEAKNYVKNLQEIHGILAEMVGNRFGDEAVRNARQAEEMRAASPEKRKAMWTSADEKRQIDLAAKGHATEFDAAAHEAATSPLNARPEPTVPMKGAGNYKLGHAEFQGLPLSIENPVGSTRSGVDPNGKKWSNTMKSHYGYLKGTVGRDKDHVDTFVGKSHASPKVFVIDQKKGNGSFDEHKVMLGFRTLNEARDAYQANYSKGWDGIRAITETSIDGFKDWLKHGDTTEPFGEQMIPAAQMKLSPKSETQYTGREGEQNGRSGSDLDFTGETVKVSHTNLGGRSAAHGWAAATRISGKGGGRPIKVYRGSSRPFSTADYSADALGKATGNPTSGFGVWHTLERHDAAGYGEHVSAHYLDIRNPKIYNERTIPSPEDHDAAVAIRKSLQKQGYDGMVINYKAVDGPVHVVSFHEDQVIPHVEGVQFSPKQKEFLAKAVRTPEGKLAAPNGAPSKLDPRQWHQVRSPQFKKWFGDWEAVHNGKDGNGVWNTDKGVSKVVDENGEPRVVHHGSKRAGFTKFDMNEASSNQPYTMYFSSQRDVSRTYSGTRNEADLNTFDEDAGQYDEHRGVYSVFLNLRNPSETTFEGANWDGQRNDQWEVVHVDGEQDKKYGPNGEGFFSRQEAEELARASGDEYEVVEAGRHYEDTHSIGRDAGKYEQDGAIIHEVVDDGGEYDTYDTSTVYIAVDPSQIKSAVSNSGKFDPKDNDIRYSPKDAIKILEKPTPTKRMSIDEVGQMFDKMNPGKKDFNDPAVRREIIKQATIELDHQLAKDTSGHDWYGRDTRRAFDITGEHTPYLREGRQPMLFALAVGIHSNSTDVMMNWPEAGRNYQHYLREEEFSTYNPDTGGIWSTKAGHNKGKHLEMLNNVIKELGENSALDWMYSDHPVRELNAARREYGNMGPDVPGKADDRKPGYMVFGPKVGKFIGNLNGIDGVTVDKWATRTLKRWLGGMTGKDGTLVDTPTEVERAQFTDIAEKLGVKYGLKPQDVQAALWYFEQDLFKHLGAGEGARGFSEAAKRFYEQDTGDRYVERSGDATRSSRDRISAESGSDFDLPSFSPKSINFEVAPNPRNTELTDHWNKIPQRERLAISERVAQNAIPKYLESMGVVGKITNQVGSYEEFTNPSFQLNVDKGDLMQIARELGHAFSQESMMVMSPDPIPGVDKMGSVNIEIGNKTDKQIEGIYQRLHQIKMDGEQVVTGQTTANGIMSILHPLSVDGDALGALVDKQLSNKYAVTSHEVYAAFPGEGKNHYELQKSNPSRNEKVAWQRADSLRGRIEADLGRELAGRAGAESVQKQAGVRGSDRALAGDSRAYQGNEGSSLEGLPRQVEVDGRPVDFSAFKPAQDAARDYTANAGITYDPPTRYAKVDPARATRIADAFQSMRHDPQNPEVKAAYNAMIKETLAQYDAILKTGLRVEFIDYAKTGDPYGNPRNAILDVVKNNHLYVFSTRDGFGSSDLDVRDNPLLGETRYKFGGKPALVNDIFRVVHDYFGHVKEGVGFRADGEENAWRAHSAMYSDLARKAMTSETRGQNSWVNFGPHAEANRTANGGDTVYADQKIGLLPDWVVNEGVKFSPKENPYQVITRPDVPDADIYFEKGHEYAVAHNGEFMQSFKTAKEAAAYAQSEFDMFGGVLQSPKAPIFYSHMARQIDTLMGKQEPAKELALKVDAWARSGKYKADELYWSGLKEWLELQDGKVTKQQVADFIAEGGVKVTEKVLGGDGGVDQAQREGFIEAHVESLRELYEERRREYIDKKIEDLYGGYYTKKATNDDGETVWELRHENYDPQESFPTEDEAQGEADSRNDDEVDEHVRDIERNYRDFDEDEARSSAEEAADNEFESDGNQTKYEGYQQKGGDNYREILLTLAPKERGPLTPEERYEFDKLRANRPLPPEGEQRLIELMNISKNAQIKNPAFHSSHFDEPNILAHIRLNEVSDANGDNVLLLNENQSDWAQKGRKDGFQQDVSPERLEELKVARKDAADELENAMSLRSKHRGDILFWKDKFKSLDADPRNSVEDVQAAERKWMNAVDIVDADDKKVTALYEADAVAERDLERATYRQGVPEAPFVKNTAQWAMLGFKRLLRYAAENNFDKLAWNTGAEQVERYRSALRKAVDTINWTKSEEGIHLKGEKNGRSVVDTTQKENDLSDAIGKTMADRIIADPNQSGTIRGSDITVSDTGMAGFYDRILPAEANKYVKKWGVKVEKFDFDAMPDSFNVERYTVKSNYVASSSQRGQNHSEWYVYDAVEERNLGTFKSHGQAVAFVGIMNAKELDALKNQRMGIVITPEMKESVLQGQPLFSPKQVREGIKRVYKDDRFWKILLDESTAQSGPFDGGCLICAKAIIRANGGGELVRITSDVNGGQTEHYGARIDGKIFDFDGEHLTPGAWIKTFEAREKTHRDLSFAEGYDADSDTPDDPRAEKRIAALLNGEADIRQSPKQTELDARFGGISVKQGADAIAAMSQDARDNLDIYEAPGGFQAYSYWEARKLMPNPSDKLKKVTDRNSDVLSQDYDYIANVDGELYGIAKQEDPDDDENESAFVYSFARVDDRSYSGVQTMTSDVGELFAEIRKHAAKVQQSPKANPNISLPEETRLQAAQRVVQEQDNRWLIVQDWLKENGIPLSAMTDVYKAMKLYPGRTATRKEDFRKNTFMPIVKELESAGYSLSVAETYLHAQHARERNDQIAKVNPKMPDGGSGMSNAAAAAILNSLNDPKLITIANKLQAIADDTLNIRLAAGLIEQDAFNAMRGAYRKYVPLKGSDEVVATGTGKGFDVKAKMKRAMGHDVREEHIIENILRDHEVAIMLAEKNRVAKVALQFAIEADDPDLITIDKPIKRAVMGTEPVYEIRYQGGTTYVTHTLADARAAMAHQIAQTRLGPKDFSIIKTTNPRVQYQASPMLAENEAGVYLNGQFVRMQINDPISARSYKNLGIDHLVGVLKVNREINTWLSKAYTGYDPRFLLKNMVRDFGEGTINLVGDYGAGMAARVLANYPAQFADLLNYAARAQTTPMITDYRADGGSTGAAYLGDLERIGNDILKGYNDYAGAIDTYKRQGGFAAAKVAGDKTVGALVHWIEVLNQAGENAMRLATYKTLRENGYSRDDAALAAKDVTLNFNRKGEIGAQAGALWLFFNPAVQGSARLLQTLLTSEHRGQAWALIGAMAALFYLMAAANDDADKKRWEETPDYAKAHNLIVPLGKQQLMIPVPYGYGFFGALGTALHAVTHGQSVKKTAYMLANSFAEGFSPIGNPVGDKPDFKNLTQILPFTPIKIGAEIGVNRTGLGGPVYPENQPEGKPDSSTMFRNTKGTVWDWAAGGLNKATGGNKAVAGWVDVHPDTIKSLWRSATGGAGTFITDNVQLANLGVQGVKPELREIPIASSFLREPVIGDTRKAFWDAANEVKRAQTEFSTAKKNLEQVMQGKDDGAKKEAQGTLSSVVEQNRTLMALGSTLQQFTKAATAKRDQEDALMADKSVPLGERRVRVKEMEAEEKRLYDRFIAIFKTQQGRARR